MCFEVMTSGAQPGEEVGACSQGWGRSLEAVGKGLLLGLVGATDPLHSQPVQVIAVSSPPQAVFPPLWLLGEQRLGLAS